MKSFRIGEFAKRHGISVQLLKNYDQQGILHPFMRDETGRYYLDSQSVELIEKQYLNGTGLSLQEARALCDRGSLAEWSAHLAQAPAFIENEIRERQKLLEYTHEIDSCIKQIREKAPWRIEPWDGGKFIPQEISETYPWGKAGAPILQIWQRHTLPGTGGGHSRTEWGTIVLSDFPLEVPRKNKIPESLCFVYAHSIPKEKWQASERSEDRLHVFEEPLRIMAENHLEPAGSLYQRWLCETHEETGVFVHVLTRIPMG